MGKSSFQMLAWDDSEQDNRHVGDKGLFKALMRTIIGNLTIQNIIGINVHETGVKTMNEIIITKETHKIHITKKIMKISQEI